MKTAAAHNPDLQLPAGVYSHFRSEEERQHKPATQLMKQAVEYRLEEHKKLTLHEEIARFAAKIAGTSDDLDEQLEDAGVEHLNNSVKQL